MTSTTEPVKAEVAAIKTVINQFLQERLQPKLDKLKEGDDAKRRQLLEAHRPENWIADAARRASRIQQATHVLKFSHPEAIGTNLFSNGNRHANAKLIGTHVLDKIIPDTVYRGGAGDMPVMSFLAIEVYGQCLLDRAAMNDAALTAALPADKEIASQWMSAFASIREPMEKASTHRLAKQIYWPLVQRRINSHRQEFMARQPVL